MKMLTKLPVRSLWYTSITVLFLLGPGSQLSAAAPGKTQHLPSLDSVPEGLAPSDWSSIRAAYEGQRHAALAVEGGYQARNPGQQWRTTFDGRGFSTQPDAGGWEWGLELRSYGFAGEQAEQIGGQAQAVKIEGQRVTYQWSKSVHEWFVNDQRGLEHGFTIRERPQGGTGANPKLQFDLSVRGGLRPELSPDGLTVRFVAEQGIPVINYAGLKVWDAEGKSLPAEFVAAEEGVRLSVDERGARYPITVDPIAQQAYLKATYNDAGDLFGFSVAISGDTVVIGAPGEDSNATGVNGNQASNAVIGSGSAYVFVRSGTIWTQQAYLKASNTDLHDGFGQSVAISGDTIIVGAPGEDSNGINGNQTDNSLNFAGAAYVFVRSGTTWTQQAYLKASNPGADDYFGREVAISAGTIVVGAAGEDSNATGVNGNQADNSAQDAGAAYIFVRGFDAWSQQAYLKASNTAADDEFGSSVAISGGTVVVGAPGQTSPAPRAGAAYVFVRSTPRPPNLPYWSQTAYLKASNPDGNDNFGSSVAISGSTVVVGADGERSSATGVNGNQADNSLNFAGAAYIFVRNETVWTQQAYLKASNTGAGDRFGNPVAISEDTVVVGAYEEESNATGVNGNQTDNSLNQAGAAYVFLRSGSTWAQQTYLKASNTDALDAFGRSVAISGSTVVVGAHGEASSSSDQSNNSLGFAGAAYVFTAVDATPTPTPPPTPTPSPTPSLTPSPTPGLVGNISTRLPVGTGDNVLIEGFIVQGPAGSTKKIIVRAIGPWLTQFGIADALANPTLEIRDGSNAVVATNDDWGSTQTGGIITGDQSAEIGGSGLAPGNDLESAIIADLPPGSYTAVVRGVGNTVGTGVVDAYDLSAASPARLVNLATRGLIQPGDKLMIAGFIVQNAPVKAVIRAIGPSLSRFGISNALPDTTLQLRDGNGAIVRENDDWQTTQQQELQDSQLQPTDSREAALIETIPPGQYTAQVRGKPEAAGIGVVEIYFLP